MKRQTRKKKLEKGQMVHSKDSQNRGYAIKCKKLNWGCVKTLINELGTYVTFHHENLMERLFLGRCKNLLVETVKNQGPWISKMGKQKLSDEKKSRNAC